MSNLHVFNLPQQNEQLNEFPSYQSDDVWKWHGLTVATIGDVLMMVSNYLIACYLVYQEKVLSQYEVDPFEQVGWEGETLYCKLFSSLFNFHPCFDIPSSLSKGHASQFQSLSKEIKVFFIRQEHGVYCQQQSY